ncbi:hypothetical protein FHS15_005181 [Paenibacillus castaneae]|uniref:hypothetical protein n=1 Tax=Paenibacillus castaneae TaxID=474957 RepID=UPI001ABA31E2|nr:hypothetical protein [Paenibacillus castaneae]NIK79997.1 hypothetical protein [Paenibacillus castaneae]
MGMYSFLLKRLFIQMPSIVIDSREANEYERLLLRASQSEGFIHYDCHYPKYRFISYMCKQKKCMAHGSNTSSIEQFEPRKQTLFNGKYVEAVFATKDAIWPLFYAVFDRSKLYGNFRNGCLRIHNEDESYYFFSLTEQTMCEGPWTEGSIYFLPEVNFRRVSNRGVFFDEWISKEPVVPSYRLEVTKEDFPLLEKVSIHKSDESIFKTWFSYKRRVNNLLLKR